MGYLFHIVLAMAALGVAEAGVTTGWRQPWLVLGACGLPYLLAEISRRLYVRGRFEKSELVLRVLHTIAPLLYFGALSAFGWTRTVEQWFGHAITFLAWPQPGLLVVLLPFVAYELASIDARMRAVGTPNAVLRSWRNFQMRMFLSGVVPIVAYVVVASVVGLNAELKINIEEVPLFNGLFAAALLVVLGLSLPTLLRNTWETVPLGDGVQRDLLQAARQAGFRSRALLVWKTGNMMANAAIVGVSARSRVVLFSDSLLAQLDLRELAAVFAHEMGHAFRHHVPIFVVWATSFFMGADLLASWIFPNSPWLAGGLVVATMGVWYFAFGFMSRRFELEADLFSLDLLHDHHALISALERVGGKLRDVASWRHFSTTERVRFLERATVDPTVGVRLAHDLRRWTWLGCALFALTAFLQVRHLASTFDVDRVRADLRLGHYARALEHAAEAREREPRTAALLERVRPLANAKSDVSEGDLERAARAALRHKDARAALEWLELGEMRGRDDLGDVAGVLRSVLDANADTSEGEGLSTGAWEGLSPELDRAWHADIEAALR